MLDEEVKMTILGEQERNLLKNKSPFILPDNPSEKGFNANQIKRTMYEPILLLFDWLKKQGLETADIVELLKENINGLENDNIVLESKVHERATKLELDNLNGIIKLIGKDKSGNDIELSSIDLPTEKIIKNVYYDNATSELVFQFENANDVRVPIGDIFELDNYYTKTDTDNLLNNIILENTQQQELIDNLEYENSRLTKQVKNLQASSEGSTFVYEEENSIAYEKDVPSGASPYAILNKVGGMSYVSENLIKLEDVAETTKNGVTYSVENGVLTINGTNSSSGTIFITIPIKEVSLSGHYSNNYFQTGTCTGTSYWRYEDLNGNMFVANNANQINIELNTTINHYVVTMKTGATATNYTFKPMLVKGSTAPTEFQPYFEGIRNSAVTEINSNGANLLDLSEFNGSINGINWYTENGRIYFSGTTTASTFTTSIQCFLPKGTYTLKEFTNNTKFSFFIQENESENKKTLLSINGTTNTSMTTTTNRDWNCICYIYINLKDTNVDGMVVSPMLVKGSTAPTEFSEYKNIGVKTLPTALLNLTDYGKGTQGRVYSVDYVYSNYIDFINKKYIRQVQEINLLEFEWSFMNENDGANSRFRGFIKSTNKYSIVNAPVVFSKRYTFANSGVLYQHKQDNVGCFETNRMIAIYDSEFDGDLQAFITYLQENQIICICPLETPIEEDISSLLNNIDEFIEIEELGSIKFENEYKQDVPSTITYQVKI